MLLKPVRNIIRYMLVNNYSIFLIFLIFLCRRKANHSAFGRHHSILRYVKNNLFRLLKKLNFYSIPRGLGILNIQVSCNFRPIYGVFFFPFFSVKIKTKTKRIEIDFF